MEFDGAEITSIEAKLPAFVVEMPEGYKRGTHIQMMVEFRVRSVRFEEDRKGNLTHQMILAIEDIELKKVILPSDDSVVIAVVESDEEISGQTSIEDALDGSQYEAVAEVVAKYPEVGTPEYEAVPF